MKPNLVLGITGASGAVYAVRLLDVLTSSGCDVQLSISPAGQAVLKQELNLTVDLEKFELDSLLPTPEQLLSSPTFETLRTMLPKSVLAARNAAKMSITSHVARGEVRYHHYQNLFAAIASGSSLTTGMVICPCSGGTLSGIAHGSSQNLIQRAADVHLKERRKLILVPRETPLSMVQLDNMRRCAEAGAVVLPAMPGFYHGVESLQDLIDFVVARICDQLGIEHQLMKRWGEGAGGISD
jgi:4-hydroxy-3-polyprenylbenzoate decarboxylase